MQEDMVRRRLMTIATFAGVLVGLVAVATADAGNGVAAAGSDLKLDGMARPDGPIRETDFTIFLALLEQSGLTETVMTTDLTLFVPTDDGFVATLAALGEGVPKKEDVVDLIVSTIESYGLDIVKTVQGILLYHAVEGKLMAADVLSMTELKTLLPGETIMRGGQDMDATQLADGATSTRDPRIIFTDYMEMGVTAHVIDRMLVPKSLADISDAFVAEGAGVEPVASGKGCKYCEDGELCTATPWDKRMPAQCLPSPPRCYLASDRNIGAEGETFVPYAPCCSGNESVLAPELGAGYWCLP